MQLMRAVPRQIQAYCKELLIGNTVILKSQLDSAEADFARRMQELDQAESKADITSQPVAFGVMVVESKD